MSPADADMQIQGSYFTSLTPLPCFALKFQILLSKKTNQDILEE
jgi:hypothetical protein